MKVENLILGAGIAGLGASYGFYQKGKSSCVVEKTAPMEVYAIALKSTASASIDSYT